MKAPAAYKILVVCQAGEKTGLGHLSRALVICRALLQQGFIPELLVHGEPLTLADTGSMSVRFTSNRDLCATISATTAENPPDLVIFDLQPQRIPPDITVLLSTLKASGCKLITIDAMADLRHLVDLVFIPAFQLKPELNQGDISRLVYGWDCFLLKVAARTTHWQDGKNLLVLTGGSDATNLGQSWPALLNTALPADTTLHWVTGPYAALPQWPGQSRITFCNHQAPDNLQQLMGSANYAVTVYGVSFYELLYYGVPTVVFSPYGDKDASELDAIAASGIALVAKDEKEAIVKLNQLMASPSVATAISAKAARQMARPGEQKLVGLITQLLDK